MLQVEPVLNENRLVMRWGYFIYGNVTLHLPERESLQSLLHQKPSLKGKDLVRTRRYDRAYENFKIFTTASI